MEFLEGGHVLRSGLEDSQDHAQLLKLAPFLPQPFRLFFIQNCTQQLDLSYLENTAPR